VSFWDSILGRRKPVQAKLDALFALPGAAITLQTAAGFTPTGVGSVCYREAEGAAFAQTQADVVALHAGAEALAADCGVTIAGGDLVSGPALTIAVTVIGWADREGAGDRRF